jgi:hypothetical protein
MQKLSIQKKIDKSSSENDEQQIAKETQQSGKVTTEVYKKYFTAVNNLPFVCFVVFLLVLSQVLHSGVSFFISIW